MTILLLALAAAQDLGATPLSEAPIRLLAGRLSARFPDGAAVEARQRGIMAAPEADERETRVVWTSGVRKIVVMAYEQLETAGDDLKKDVAGVVKTWDKDAPDAFRAVDFPLRDPTLRACGVEPAAIDPERPAVFLFGLFTAREDRTIQHLAVYANPEAAKDAAGAVALARKIAASVAAGERKLVVAAGRRTLHEAEGRRLTIDVPEGFVSAQQKGPDFKVASLARLVPLGKPRAVVGAYLGGHPAYHHERADAPSLVVEEPGKVLDKDVVWHVWSEKAEGVETRMAEAIFGLPDSRELLLHVFASAPDADGFKALRAALLTLRLEPAK